MCEIEEITIHPPLNKYDIEAVILYDMKIIEKQLKKEENESGIIPLSFSFISLQLI